MKKIPLALCSALLLFSIPAGAQSNYDTQKAKLKPVRFETVDELRVVARNYLGKPIELRGQVKGNFARGENIALMIQVDEGQNTIVEAPSSFRGSSATRPGATVRLICRVDGSVGNDVSLTLLAATDAPESAQLFRADDDNDLIVAPPSNGSLPSPDQIMIGPDAPLGPTRGKPQIRITPSRPASRGMNGNPAQRATPRTPYVLESGPQRGAFKDLARRTNPKLQDQMAEYIAASIIAAAQTHNLDPRFLAAVVKVESSFDPYCLSSSGAMGLGQLMPFNLRPLGVGNAWDPMQNLHGSAKLLRKNLDTYANQPNGTLLAVAAYHAGVGAVNRAGKQVPPRASTQKYVWKVYYAYRALAPELF
ncbi:lytic transglycosylase domain-containing protein [bacterium]|nr:MAG: lytic transglycosylase domain-containing protein [bacterium]